MLLSFRVVRSYLTTALRFVGHSYEWLTKPLGSRALTGMGKLRIRFERRSDIDIHLAPLSLACSIIGLRLLTWFC